jgi:hypothetical protein
MSSPFPRNPAELHPEWLTMVLRTDGVLHDAQIVALEVSEDVGKGAAGQLVRASLTYDREEPGAPQSVIAKFSSTDAAVRDFMQRIGAYEREVRFYRTIAGSYDLPAPHCYFGQLNVTSGDMLLLLEDLDHMRCGSTATGCSLPDAALAIDAIASIHTRLWQAPALQGWKLPRERTEFLQQWYHGQQGPFLATFGSHVPDVLLPTIAQLGDLLPDLLASINRPPQTLIHMDYHLDNIFFSTSPDTTNARIIDWGLCASGRGGYDLAYLLGVCLTTHDRRINEMALLQRYHATLLQDGVQDYPFEQCQADYRCGLLCNLVQQILHYCDGQQLADAAKVLSFTLVQRIATAVLETNATELVESARIGRDSV